MKTLSTILLVLAMAGIAQADMNIKVSWPAVTHTWGQEHVTPDSYYVYKNCKGVPELIASTPNLEYNHIHNHCSTTQTIFLLE